MIYSEITLIGISLFGFAISIAIPPFDFGVSLAFVALGLCSFGLILLRNLGGEER